MAFTGTATVTQISDSMVRITGLSLASGASGVIALATTATPPAGAVVLPASFKPGAYTYNGNAVGLQDCIEVTADPDAVGVATAIPVSVVKTGTSPTTFVATLTNTHGSLATPNLEIFVRNHE